VSNLSGHVKNVSCGGDYRNVDEIRITTLTGEKKEEEEREREREREREKEM
jgi:hypothetical protein